MLTSLKALRLYKLDRSVLVLWSIDVSVDAQDRGKKVSTMLILSASQEFAAKECLTKPPLPPKKEQEWGIALLYERVVLGC